MESVHTVIILCLHNFAREYSGTSNALHFFILEWMARFAAGGRSEVVDDIYIEAMSRSHCNSVGFLKL